MQFSFEKRYRKTSGIEKSSDQKIIGEKDYGPNYILKAKLEKEKPREKVSRKNFQKVEKRTLASGTFQL
jgi:3'-phosphoadenosine 5'-phosphosulfate (PAPS) 3'-phosphatase